MGCNSTKSSGEQLVQCEDIKRITKQSSELIEIQQNILKHLNKQQCQKRTSVTSLQSTLSSSKNSRLSIQKSEMTLSTIVLQTEIGPQQLNKKLAL
ncbi:unnamed protein product [Paramecium pentaurelia]|uniref:Uncharacterized protein n=1 Tax=Paramecium pentaurelia TaxID=43138 RepID=A0A8S1VXI6_9CILI|nr:unnamed protein product [Paramecium pentaurelia]